MRNRLAMSVVLVVLAAMLAALPVLGGCGSSGDTGTVNKIKYGWCWDVGGSASYGVVQLYNGFNDYLRMAKETGLMPDGVEFELMTYDTRSDAGRVLPGYVWLKGQGMELLSAAPQDCDDILLPECGKDNIPIYATSIQKSIYTKDLLVTEYGSPEAQLEVVMQWISDTDWNYTSTGRKPKIGIEIYAGVPFYDSQRVAVEEWIAANPDKFEWVTSQVSPATTTSWVSEILKLKDCDYIVTGLSGGVLASFMKESRTRGYKGKFIGALEGSAAWTQLLKAAMTDDQLDGSISGSYMPWYSETTIPVIQQINEYIDKYHLADSATLHQGTGQLNGWFGGMILVDALNRAVDKVGAANVNGQNLFEALKETNMTVEGWDTAWQIDPDKIHSCLREVKIIQYSKAISDWVPITAFRLPPSFS
ncbi:MAG: ABC transporter substrate-binding protein [Chloroflexi bacterium]|nr:ABC transporter substrate-binding protein [Chloroflexota bacterium]